VPTQLARALDAGLREPSGLRAVLLGGAGAPRSLLARAAAAGVPVAQTYGLTQACSQVTVSEPGDLDTQGVPLPGVRVEIARDGEILVAGPTVAEPGTLRTGDLGVLDERGRLVVIGRKSDTIVTGGENVAPAESRRSCSSIPPWPTPARSGVRIPNGARRWSRRWSSARRGPGRAASLLRPPARRLQGPQGHRDRRRAAPDRVGKAPAPHDGLSTVLWR
jgi:acyl-CoA synthetase (AMP-forming)/AMP-acid ligase II